MRQVQYFFSSSDIFCLNNCSGNGECNQETGICNCGESYSGSDCSCNYNILSVFYEFWPVEVFYDKKISFEVKKCPNDCNGHGVCNRITGKCKCEFLYGGYDCHGKS